MSIRTVSRSHSGSVSEAIVDRVNEQRFENRLGLGRLLEGRSMSCISGDSAISWPVITCSEGWRQRSYARMWPRECQKYAHEYENRQFGQLFTRIFWMSIG